MSKFQALENSHNLYKEQFMITWLQAEVAEIGYKGIGCPPHSSPCIFFAAVRLAPLGAGSRKMPDARAKRNQFVTRASPRTKGHSIRSALRLLVSVRKAHITICFDFRSRAEGVGSARLAELFVILWLLGESDTLPFLTLAWLPSLWLLMQA